MRLLSLLLLAACGSPITGPTHDNTGDSGKDTAADADPTLVVSVTEVDFGEIGYAEQENAIVTLQNTGGATLEVTSISADSPFRSSPSSVNVAPGTTTQITVSVQLSDYEDHVGNLLIVSNDPANGSVAVTLHAVLIRDVDGDGFETMAAGGDDCDDGKASIHPGATETWYDGIDQDCGGTSDYDQDGDGYDAETDNHHPAEGTVDCNDTSATYNPGADDVPYDNKDTNCDGADDYDVDGDGYRSDAYGAGTDCDDNDATVSPEGVEGFDARDNDCNGVVDDDAKVSVGAWLYHADGSYDRAGNALAIGDLDADGDDELVVGSPYVGARSTGATGVGGLSVFSGGPDLLPSGTTIDKADAFFQGVTSGEGLGMVVSIVGDWDDDGHEDLAVQGGTYESSAGVVYVLSGAQVLAGYDTSASLVEITGATDQAFGHGLSTRLDLDGDGVDDLVSLYVEGGVSAAGLLYGGGSGVLSSAELDAAWTFSGNSTGFHASGVYGDDLDGDGLADLVLGDGAADVDGVTDAGGIWALWGTSGRQGTDGVAVADGGAFQRLAVGVATSEGLGSIVQLGEDWDGDGDAELWTYDDGDAIDVIEGGPSLRGGYDPVEDVAVSYLWSSSTDPTSLHRAGDWDADGVADMITWSDSGSGAMSVFSSGVQSGSSNYKDGRIGSIIGSATDGNSAAGQGLPANGGDLNGDGLDDLAVGDPEYDGNAGEVYLYLAY